MKHTESTLQINCVRWFRLQYPHLSRLLFAVPNGGKRGNPVTGAILKAEGVVAGVADLILFVPAQGVHALCIEMKTPTGRQSEHQAQWQRSIEQQGYRYELCRSFEDFIHIITSHLRDDE